MFQLKITYSNGFYMRFAGPFPVCLLNNEDKIQGLYFYECAN